MQKLHIDLREIHQIGEDTTERIVPGRSSPQMSVHHMGAVGISDAGHGYRMIRPRPTFVHVLVCTGGAGRVWVDGGWSVCREGMAYLGPPGAPHGFETLPRGRWKFDWLFYHIPVEAAPLISGDRPLLLSVDHRPIHLCLEGLYLEYTATTHTPEALAKWADLLHGYALSLAGPMHTYDRLWRLWEQVNADLAAPWSLETLSDAAMVGAEQLRRLCHASLGRSPMQHVTHLRMRKARALLTSTPMKISVIARLVGYENAFAFSNTFHRVVGHPPSQSRTGRPWNG